MLYISNIRPPKIKRSSKIYTFKKIKDFIGYAGLLRLYKLIHRSSEYMFLLLLIVRERNTKYICTYIFNLQTSNFMTLRNGKMQVKNLKDFKTNI